MAKDQNLTLNHEKLSGVCGRLRCCLKYEQEVYQRHRKGLPKLGKRVITPDGEGRVKDIAVLEERVRVQLTSGEYREYGGDELSRPDDPGATTPRAQPVPAPIRATPDPKPDGDATMTTPAAKKKRKRRRRRPRDKGGGSTSNR